MKLRRSLGRLSSWLASADRVIMTNVEQHTNLLMAIVVLGLSTWGIATGHNGFVLGIVCIGAAGYFAGATIAVATGLICALLSIRVGPGIESAMTTALLELVGYMLAARLGFRHRQEQAVLKSHGNRQVASPHREQVMPWHISNEMRTSLAAVRFLLFPVQDEQHRHALEEAVKEIARLEGLFQAMEKDVASTDQSPPTRQVK